MIHDADDSRVGQAAVERQLAEGWALENSVLIDQTRDLGGLEPGRREVEVHVGGALLGRRSFEIQAGEVHAVTMAQGM